MAKDLVTTILENNGQVFIDAKVKQIIFDDKRNHIITGVLLENGVVIPCKRVVSSAGYQNTFSKLVPSSIAQKYNLSPQIKDLNQSSGFVMCNIGIRGKHEQFDINNMNKWHIPVAQNWDAFEGLYRLLLFIFYYQYYFNT